MVIQALTCPMLDGCTLQAYSTKALKLVHASASYSFKPNDRMQVSKCDNTSEINVVFEQYRTKLGIVLKQEQMIIIISIL